MNADDMLAKIDALYEGRTTGDRSSFDQILAADATFSFAGEDSLIAAFPGGRTNSPEEVAEALYEQIDMLARRPVETFSKGNKLAVL